MLEYRIRNYDELCQRLQLKNKILRNQLDMLRDNQKKISEIGLITHEKNRK